MKEIVGNLWDYYNPKHILCITTNGTIKKNGEAVMGRGCAHEAALMIPSLPGVLGNRLKNSGNNVFMLQENPTILSFPVKHNWWEQADIQLIQKSALQLAELAHILDLPIILPRPGCGNGHLKWEDVKPVIAPILSDNIHVISW